MANTPPLLRQQLDALERTRKERFARHRKAFRQLDKVVPTAGAAGGTEPETAWQEYCEAVRSLEDCLRSLESLIWNIDTSEGRA